MGDGEGQRQGEERGASGPDVLRITVVETGCGVYGNPQTLL